MKVPASMERRLGASPAPAVHHPPILPLCPALDVLVGGAETIWVLVCGSAMVEVTAATVDRFDVLAEVASATAGGGETG
ncbi:hypothetical protein TRAPUB_8949 [Trametes pubescens]|uniref:Uncharacterized protein n=1 Tax=Trametes pubescens TaxID=154538 RepID=A0A1M2W3X4_TRAPU|nr:hypothetical protein TRAPUB_8949 [Trametes pubescens]